ncbi:MAG: aminotransferase class I/II-fold pyridoxal phosphate-dependent enzyme [Candidatus Nezhaarchaeota archaeon]|nr:aminotransferase class I/II-fold pyridoxal phosphate-dependent enzyme [Candidatus Nezhaarchaeota archaeon]
MIYDSVRIETLLAKGFWEPNDVDGVVPPIVTSTTFPYKDPKTPGRFVYARASNPTSTILEKAIAYLEGAKYGFAFSSGMAAIATALLSMGPCKIVAEEDMYGGTYRLLKSVLPKLGYEVVTIDMTKLNKVPRSIFKGAKVFFFETPTNPQLKAIDIAEISEVAHENDAIAIVDNTFATPILQQPLKHGADVVIHSSTKLINGHSDVVGGLVALNDEELASRLSPTRATLGSIMSSIDAWLTLRGLRTLHLRVKKQCDNASIIAETLANNPKIEEVIYPSLSSYPYTKTILKQMRGPGCIVTLKIKGGVNEALNFLKNLKLFTVAVSLGGLESLACHPYSMTHGAMDESYKKNIGLTDNMIRLSIGAEDPFDLIEDLKNALKSI